jgi:hypothetical protein
MKTLIIAILTLTNGSVIEIEAPSLEACTAWSKSVKFEITDEGGVTETVAAVECKTEMVNTPDAEGWDV